jgi:hypothetical protein
MVIFSNGKVISIFFAIRPDRHNLAFLLAVVNSGQAILAIVIMATNKEAGFARGQFDNGMAAKVLDVFAQDAFPYLDRAGK